jgi:hypothetical protein
VKCPATQEVERGTPEEQMNEKKKIYIYIYIYINKILSKMPEQRNLGTLAYKNHYKRENKAND